MQIGAVIGNGGLVSTVDDLVRWAAAVEARVVLDDGATDALRTEVFGPREISIDGERVYAYSGLNDFGFGAAVGEVPSLGTTVVVASNAAADSNQSVIMVQLLQMSLGALLELSREPDPLRLVDSRMAPSRSARSAAPLP